MSAIPFAAGAATADEADNTADEGGYGHSGYGTSGYGGDGDDQSTGGGGSDDGESLPHVIVFDGSEVSEATDYEFTVSGDVTKSSFEDATIDDGDVVDGSTVDGTVDSGAVDAYRFDGEITAFRLFGPADVDVQYDAPDEEPLPHEIRFDGSEVSEATDYEFTVSGDVTKSSFEDATIDDEDVVDGSTVDGTVDSGAVDAFRFDGEITAFRLFGPADVDVQYDVDR